jgi:chromosome segregation ATPase
LSNAVKEINALVGEDRRKLEEVFDFFARTSREVESVHNDLSSVARSVETLAKAQDDLASRVAKVEEVVRAICGTGGAQDQVHQLDRRLEVQANAIRTLHTAVQARDERLERLMAAFQSLHALSTETAAPSARRSALPDEM